MKREMSSFDVLAITSELKSIEARINKVYQLDNEIKLALNVKDYGRQDLIIKVGKAIYLTKYPKENPKKPTTFAMALRKYLNNGIIEDIYQVDFDRIVILKIRAKESYYLIVELFGKGNVILTDKDFNILAIFRKAVYKGKELDIKQKYIFPESRVNPFEIDEKKLMDIINNSKKDLVRTLATSLGLGGLYAEEVCMLANIDKNKREISLQESKKIVSAIRNLRDKVGKEKPRIILKDGEYIDVVPINLKFYESYKFKEFENFNEACDEYFTRIDIEEIKRRIEEKYKSELEKYKKRLRSQAEGLKNAILSERKYREIGDLIYLHYTEIEKILDTIRKAMEKYSLQEIKRIVEKNKDKTVVKSVNPKEKSIEVEINSRRFKIFIEKSVHENADVYYSKAKKAKEKIKGTREAIEETKEIIKNIIKKMKSEINREFEKLKPKERKIRKKAWFEKFRWFISSEGFLVLGGRDAKQNEILVKKHMSKDDIFVHTQIPGAPCVIIKTEGRKIGERTIQEAFDFAASYSKAWKEGLAVLDTYWVNADQVSKRAEHGEYVKTGSFIVRGKRNYGYGKLRIAVGVEINEEAKLIAGPVDAVKEHAKYYVILAPGKMKSKETAEKIKKILINRANEEDKKKIDEIEIEEIQRFLPSGGHEILA